MSRRECAEKRANGCLPQKPWNACNKLSGSKERQSAAALPAHGRVIEVGCGTGQMTLPFAQRGYTVVALDQGERLAALTRPALSALSEGPSGTVCL